MSAVDRCGAALGEPEKQDSAIDGSAVREEREVFDFRSEASKEAALAAAEDALVLTKPVFFVGFMGAGKTSIARKLARSCGVGAVDMDTYLERREGKKVNDIFAEVAEEGFRLIETDVLEELAAKEPLLVSCGGGVIIRPENRAILKEAGYTVYLKVTPDEAASRISDKSTRPLFQDIEAAKRLCEMRLPLYAEVADATVDTAGKGVTAIAREVKAILRKEGVLCPQQR